jgi:hypothetical protein
MCHKIFAALLIYQTVSLCVPLHLRNSVRSLIGFINQTKQQLNQLHHRTNGTIGHM